MSDERVCDINERCRLDNHTASCAATCSYRTPVGKNALLNGRSKASKQLTLLVVTYKHVMVNIEALKRMSRGVPFT